MAYRYERTIWVYCRHCHEQFDESDPRIETSDIESNILGQDVVTFVCPECGKETTSLRRG